jgi:hypothetical protein
MTTVVPDLFCRSVKTPLSYDSHMIPYCPELKINKLETHPYSLRKKHEGDRYQVIPFEVF